jgi:hypothetical protein
MAGEKLLCPDSDLRPDLREHLAAIARNTELQGESQETFHSRIG